MNLKFEETFQGKISEIIGGKIKLFKVSGNKLEDVFEPMIFWLKTDDFRCHRFFIDTWTLHWDTYSEKEIKEIIDEDFEGEFPYIVRDIMKEFKLENSVIKDAEMVHLNTNGLLCGQLSLKLENSIIITTNDFNDEVPQQLIVTN